MPGSLRKRGNSWELRAYAGTDPETGKRHWVSATVKGSRRAAQQELAELVSRVDYPRRMTSQATVAKLLIDWFDAVSPNWSPTTASHAKSVIDHHLIPRLGRLSLRRLRTEDIDALYGELQQSGGPNGRPLTPSTVHRIHVVLHRALEQSLRWESLWVNPASHASPPSCEPAPVRPPSADEIARLLGHVSTIDLALHAFLSLAVSTGARHSQITALRLVKSTSRTGRSDSSRRSSMQRVAWCCAQRRPDAPTGWTSTRTVLKYSPPTSLGQKLQAWSWTAPASSSRTTPRCNSMEAEPGDQAVHQVPDSCEGGLPPP
jgi:hypothetical protein